MGRIDASDQQETSELDKFDQVVGGREKRLSDGRQTIGLFVGLCPIRDLPGGLGIGSEGWLTAIDQPLL